MAVKHVTEYYLTMLAQYCEEKENLKDFEQALAQGYITEDKLTEVKENFALIEENFERIKYIVFLLNKPQRKEKAGKYNKMHKKELEEFEKFKATLTAVEAENKECSEAIHESMDNIKKEIGI